MTRPNGFYPDIEDLDEDVDFILDHIAGDGYEGWANYWIGHARFDRKQKIMSELRAWQEEAKALMGTENVDPVRPGEE